MPLKRYFCLAALAGLLSANLAVGQVDQLAPAGRAADPFSLTTGSSFTASGSGTDRRTVRSAVRLETIASDVQEALAIIDHNYAGGRSMQNNELTSGAIRSMLKTLDPHSNFYNSIEFQELLGEHESEYTGTGSSIAGFNGNGGISTYIISVFPDSPAAKAGLRFGDKILAVDEKQVVGELPDTIRDMVRGRQGSPVRLTFERADDRSVNVVTMRRDLVHEPAVPKGFLLAGTTGYIDLTNGFSNATFREFEAALNDLNRQGMTSLVLDLRGNGGGILDQAIKIAEKLLPAGSTIVSQRGRFADDNRTWRAGRSKHETLPLVVLVDEFTASASEVLVGALQDNDRALIVGHRTFGKGLVQSVLSLPDGAGLTLTAARYFTPTGRSIQRDYSETGLYDYYNHRGPAAAIDKPVYAAKTITNRVVYGGDGIAPDIKADERKLTAGQVSLLDPIFFFCREFLNGRLPVEGYDPATEGSIRTRFLLRDRIVDDKMVAAFERFAQAGGLAARTLTAIDPQRSFVRDTLEYYLAMGTFGPDAANKAKIQADPEVKQALAALPDALRLFRSAQKARSARQEKSSPSLILSEQR